MTAPKLNMPLEIEVHILRDILKQLQEKEVRKGETTVFVDDETDPFEGGYSWTEIVKIMAKQKIFTLKEFVTYNDITSDARYPDWIKTTYAKINAQVTKIGPELVAREKLLKWIDGKGLKQRGRLMFDPVTGEAKLGNNIKTFKGKQLTFIRTLIEQGRITCQDMYKLLYPKSSVDTAISVIKREIDNNVLKTIKQDLGITKGKIPNPDIFESSGNYYAIIG